MLTRSHRFQRPMMILNTLTQNLDLQGVLYSILNELSESVLNQLLFLDKHSVREISSTQYNDTRTLPLKLRSRDAYIRLNLV